MVAVAHRAALRTTLALVAFPTTATVLVAPTVLVAAPASSPPTPADHVASLAEAALDEKPSPGCSARALAPLGACVRYKLFVEAQLAAGAAVRDFEFDVEAVAHPLDNAGVVLNDNRHVRAAGACARLAARVCGLSRCAGARAQCRTGVQIDVSKSRGGAGRGLRRAGERKELDAAEEEEGAAKRRQARADKRAAKAEHAVKKVAAEEESLSESDEENKKTARGRRVCARQLSARWKRFLRCEHDRILRGQKVARLKRAVRGLQKQILKAYKAGYDKGRAGS